MTAEEELAQLKKDLAAEQAKNAQLRQLLEEVLRRLGGVEGRLAKDSHNNNKPPSSDGLLRKQVSLRKKSEKKSGGQPGHPGHTFLAVERPDQVVRHRPVVYQHCQYPFEEVAGRGKERRQMHDLPEVRLRVCEHQVEEVPCPACGQQNVGSFPAEVLAPVRYGPSVQALAVYLHQGQFVPMARTCEVLEEVCGCQTRKERWCAGLRKHQGGWPPRWRRLPTLSSVARVQHGDETGLRIGGKLH